MPRRKMAIGSHGDVRVTTLEKGRVRLFTRVRDMDGVVRQVSVTGKSKEDAKRNLKAALEVRFGGHGGEVRPDMTLEQLGKVWVRKLRSGGKVTESSMDTYEWAVGVIKTHKGGLELREVSFAVVDSFIEELHAASPSTARMVRTVLGRMLGLALRHGVIASNPVKSLDALSRTKKDVTALEVEDIEVLRKLVREWQSRPGPGPRDTELGHIVDMLLATGCRIGEVLAFRWADVNFDEGTVTVNATVRHIKGKGVVRNPKPKSDASRRTLRVPAFALEMLAACVEQADTDPHAPVFPGRGGVWRNPATVRTQWRQVRAGTGYEWVRPHTFRKTVATLVDAAEGSQAASEQLGHTSDAVTKKHYIVRARVAPDVTSVLDQLAPPAAS
jgi:integrase